MGTQFNFEGASRCYHTNMKAFIVLFALFAAAMADAEADPAFFYSGYPCAFGAYGAYGSYAFHPYAYTGCRNAAGAAVPCAYHNVVKREAEAEADPALFYANAYGGYYGGFGAYPYTYGYGYPYAAYTYAGCRNNAGAAVPCAHGAVATHVVAKREADSDPAYFVSPYLAQYGFPRTFYGNGLVHTSHYGICTNYLGQQVSC